MRRKIIGSDSDLLIFLSRRNCVSFFSFAHRVGALGERFVLMHSVKTSKTSSFGKRGVKLVRLDQRKRC